MMHHDLQGARKAQKYSTSKNNTTDRVYPTLVHTHNRKLAREPYRRGNQPYMKHDDEEARNAQDYITSRNKTPPTFTRRLFPATTDGEQQNHTDEQCSQR